MKKKKKLKIKKEVKKKFMFLVIGILLVTISCEVINYLYHIERKITPNTTEKKEYYKLYDFGFIYNQSTSDYNQNGIDDYTDILNGAKKVAKINPKYVSKYYDGGYPPESEGTSADLIVWSLKEAGYDLKQLISKDIKQTQKSNENTYNIKIRDDNIDFRRITNQQIFFDRYAKKIKTDINEIGSFQPGDIIIFDYNSHIAIVSDKINKNGIPYIIHLHDDKQKSKEEDILETTDMAITDHYRFEYNEKLEKLINS